MAPCVVETYAGGRADERPLRFGTRDRRIDVEALITRWIEADARLFRVLGSDGATWLLRLDLRTDAWTVTRE